MISPQPHALTDEAPCIWIENRNRDANGDQITVTTPVIWHYYYAGSVTGDGARDPFNILVLRLRTRGVRAPKLTLWLVFIIPPTLLCWCAGER